MRRALLAALLVAAGVIACTRVVVLEGGPEIDAALPLDDASVTPGDASTTADVAELDASSDASTADAQ